MWKIRSLPSAATKAGCFSDQTVATMRFDLTDLRLFIQVAETSSITHGAHQANMALALLKFANKLDQHADSIDYDVSGAASIDLPFLRDLPFHQTGSFSLKDLK